MQERKQTIGVERQADPLSRIMQRVLTGYSQYYNRKYRKVGHVFQDRYKAILCQSDKYLGELVRYIHLNPVRANMVEMAEAYPHSSQRAYLGMEPSEIVDVDPVLRLFGAKKQRARENFALHVAAGATLGHQDSYYLTGEAGILGTEEFVDETIHRLGETAQKLIRRHEKKTHAFDADALIAAVEQELAVNREHFYRSGKSANAVVAKEMLIFAGRQSGATVRELAQITGLDPSTVSRRNDAMKCKLRVNEDLRELSAKVLSQYQRNTI